MIYLGADHGGYNLKEKVKKWLKEWQYNFTDLGNQQFDKNDDFAPIAFKVAEKVVQELESLGSRQQATGNSWKESPKGIILCRSAAGMVIAANKVKYARCAAVFDEKSARHSRTHNNANIIALSGDWLEEEKARQIIKVWLTTEFSGEVRHVRRLKQIEEYETDNR